MFGISQPQDDLGGTPGGDPAHLGAAGPGVATHRVKGVGLFGDGEVIHPPVLDLVDSRTEGVADPLLEEVIHFPGRHLRLLVLFYIFQLLPANDSADSHDGPCQGTAAVPHCGNPSG